MSAPKLQMLLSDKAGLGVGSWGFLQDNYAVLSEH